MKFIKIISFILMLIIAGCENIPSTEEIDNDINFVNNEIIEAKKTAELYSGSILAFLSSIRLESLQYTKSMLEQKRTGLRRYIKISYTVDGNKYITPINKEELLKELEIEISDLKIDLEEAEKESAEYGGLLSLLYQTNITTIKNSIAFLEQRRLLLKYDIPFYTNLPEYLEEQEPDFKASPGADIDNF